jgi:hypothetical protein
LLSSLKLGNKIDRRQVDVHTDTMGCIKNQLLISAGKTIRREALKFNYNFLRAYRLTSNEQLLRRPFVILPVSDSGKGVTYGSGVGQLSCSFAGNS